MNFITGRMANVYSMSSLNRSLCNTFDCVMSMMTQSAPINKRKELFSSSEKKKFMKLLSRFSIVFLCLNRQVVNWVAERPVTVTSDYVTILFLVNKKYPNFIIYLIMYLNSFKHCYLNVEKV